MHKYAVLHHLDVNIAKILNVGLFETMALGRNGHIEFSYLPPIIFLKSMEQQVGSPDKANVGIDFKVNAFHHIQFYGQFVLNEFKLSEMTHPRRGWWGNKYATQFGFKYVDVGNISNLDIQIESNRIRPYTFQHFTLIANYSNGNMPLMHPLGANFQEYIGIVRYQPVNKIRVEAKIINYYQGLDSAGYNMGAHVTSNYNSRPRDYGFQVGSGMRSNCNYLSLVLSYELLNQLFIDFQSIYRAYRILGQTKTNTSLISLGFRYNLNRRQYDF
ncbi:MAG: hypothetical protein NVS9B7_06280 [Flavisolibacter sp.]